MIVFPMAGLSQRFARAGYTVPKYMLPLEQNVVFDFTVAGFLRFALEEPLLFICRDVHETPDFIRSRLAALGVQNFEVIVLSRETAGQAETVLMGIDAAKVLDSEPLTIFNIDTFRIDLPDYRRGTGAGCLEVFRGDGANWSFVEPVGSTNEVARTTEKEPISDLCSTGLYHFASASLFRSAYESELASRSTTQKELYIAPIYNHLIREGLKVTYRKVPRQDIVFCGVPDEYKALIDDPRPLEPLVSLLSNVSIA
jgi:CTP:molybdopterin cytidylyltransferase MocA